MELWNGEEGETIMSDSLNAIFRPSSDPVSQQNAKPSSEYVRSSAARKESQKPSKPNQRLPEGREQGMRPAPRQTPQKPIKSLSEGIGVLGVQEMCPAPRQVSSNKSARVRKERVDKKKDIKFPVSPKQREELRRLARELRAEVNEPSKKFETISNTNLLKKALEHQSIFPERYPPLLYKDTGQYMHVEPPLADFRVIEELSLKWNLSLRKTVYRLIMNVIYRGEVDSDAYRAGK
jgi:hypothetical protein